MLSGKSNRVKESRKTSTTPQKQGSTRGRTQHRRTSKDGRMSASTDAPPSVINTEDPEDTETLEDEPYDPTSSPESKASSKQHGNISNDEESHASHRSASPSRMPAPPRLCFGLALALWIAEILIVLSLKRFGMLNNDFRLDVAVKEQLAPHIERIQLQLEESLQLGQYVDQIYAQFNETAYSSLAYLTQETKRPGYQMATAEGAQAQYPIVMVPGFVTSGLEVWAGKACAKKHFRQRLWAAMGGARSFIADRDCWRQHMILDPLTGSDPDEVRLRASQGFEAADYFMGNYWVWNKVIENLADVGYNPSNMALEAYDWRLAYHLLEERDGYFSRLKSRIEDMHRVTGKKVVLTSHSMGALVVHHFFAWVTTSTSEGGRGAGSKWVDEHLHAFINIAGSHLGVPKATTAILSGEMSDTGLIGTFGDMVEQFFGRRVRRDLWSSWGSLWTMLPKGGNALWSPGFDMCEEWGDDDLLCPTSQVSPLIAMTDASPTSSLAFDGNWSETMINEAITPFILKQEHENEGTLDFLTKFGGGFGENSSSVKLMSFHGDTKPSSRNWHDPTVTPLPYAPKMKMYCLYGTGLDTERAYFYRRNNIEPVDEGGLVANITDPVLKMDLTVESEAKNIKLGVRYVNGDGSVPLISLGYMCADAWQREDSGLNPSNTAVFTREYEHHAEFSVDDPMRAGPKSADHVDILGNTEMLEDFLRIVTDSSIDKVNMDKIESNIKEVAQKINAHELGGLRKKGKSFRLFGS
ncbi:hypothetical protein MPSEU_000259000 [Mayamaea pseudoterrestris]|nr:hypothetical protein MPSEU_000259000 [Mayamaea pseudoterrestris]